MLWTPTNADAGPQLVGEVVRAGVASGTAVLALADTLAHVALILGTRIADIAAGDPGDIQPNITGMRVRMVAGAPNPGETIYLSDTVPGRGVNVAPAIATPLGICYATVNIGGVFYADLLSYTDTGNRASSDIGDAIARSITGQTGLPLPITGKTQDVADADGNAVSLIGGTAGSGGTGNHAGGATTVAGGPGHGTGAVGDLILQATHFTPALAAAVGVVATASVNPVPINAQVGTSYAFVLGDDVASGRVLNTFNNPAPIAVTIPKHATVPFALGAVLPCKNIGVGKTTFAPEDGAVTLVPAATLSIVTGSGVAWVQGPIDTWQAIGALVA